MPDVFISYPQKEKDKAEMLASAFQSRGMHTWLAHKDLSPATSARDQIIDTLNSCNTVVLLVEPASKPSNWLQLEYMAALESTWKDKDKLLIPVMTGKGKPPAFLQHYKVWKVPENPKAWHHFSERVADTITEARPASARPPVSNHLKREWREKLEQVEQFAHRLQGEEILEGAKWHLSTADPSANRRAIELISDKYKNLSIATKSAKRPRRLATKKHKHVG